MSEIYSKDTFYSAMFDKNISMFSPGSIYGPHGAFYTGASIKLHLFLSYSAASIARRSASSDQPFALASYKSS